MKTVSDLGKYTHASLTSYSKIFEISTLSNIIQFVVA